ncbi:hypothetical protein [uncultured Cellulomonas sp.]|uniref:hypothetical protein n=1 Tax=uncultured Cellulomonas sp. TaxID=189682 RepID=UPI00261D31CE|nr:hypothetical protein [uncultured Cellulomonas sp.]
MADRDAAPGAPGAPAAPAGVALVITPVAVPAPLAATCAIAKVRVDVVPTDVGAVAVCRDSSGSAPRDAAIAVSRLLKGVPVVLLQKSGGRATASRWMDGEEGEKLSAGLALNGAPEVVEDLLLGTTTAADVPGVVSSVGMSRFRALRVLAASARANRR